MISREINLGTKQLTIDKNYNKYNFKKIEIPNYKEPVFTFNEKGLFERGTTEFYENHSNIDIESPLQIYL